MYKYAYPIIGIFINILTFTGQMCIAGETFTQLMMPLLDTHERIKSAKAELFAAEQAVKAAFSDWYPELKLTAEYGDQDRKDYIDPGIFNEEKLELNQLLWDFGVTNAKIKKARLQYQEKQLKLQQAKQKLILDAVTAYIDLITSYQVYQYALQSEENIRKQTGLEEIKVSIGDGYSTDVLQSQSQLARAISRRIRSDGDYRKAQYAYQEIFKMIPLDIEKIVPIPLDIEKLLPNNIQTALELAAKNNIEVKLAHIKYQLAQNAISSSRAKEYYPELTLSLEGKLSENMLGTAGRKDEVSGKIKLKWNFNLGGKNFNKVKETIHKLKAKSEDYRNKQYKIKKLTQIAWQKLMTAKANAIALEQQRDLTAAFLELARKERKLGHRSLIDLLSGETSLINAQSDNVAARAEVLISAFTLLNELGDLDMRYFLTIQPIAHSDVRDNYARVITPLQ